MRLLLAGMIVVGMAGCGGHDASSGGGLDCSKGSQCLALGGTAQQRSAAGVPDCSVFGATAVASCSDANRVGSCAGPYSLTGTSPVPGTIYYYAPGFSAASAQADCLSVGGTWTP